MIPCGRASHWPAEIAVERRSPVGWCDWMGTTAEDRTAIGVDLMARLPASQCACSCVIDVLSWSEADMATSFKRRALPVSRSALREHPAPSRKGSARLHPPRAGRSRHLSVPFTNTEGNVDTPNASRHPAIGQTSDTEPAATGYFDAVWRRSISRLHGAHRIAPSHSRLSRCFAASVQTTPAKAPRPRHPSPACPWSSSRWGGCLHRLGVATSSLARVVQVWPTEKP